MATMSLPAFDPRSLDSLRQAARRGESPETIRASAQQFEALMLQQMLKAMRATVPKTELTDSSERRTYEELADEQLASDLAQRGGVGLAKALERQWLPRLGAAVGAEHPTARVAEPAPVSQGQNDDSPPESAASGSIGAGVVIAAPVEERSFVRVEASGDKETAVEVQERSFERLTRPWWSRDAAVMAAQPQLQPLTETGRAPSSASVEQKNSHDPQSVPDSPQQITRVQTTDDLSATANSASSWSERFIAQVGPAARRAAQRLGVPAEYLIAQAALETGWGRAMLRRADGAPSHNLFNIKAGSNWQGEVVHVLTTEYRNGRPTSERAAFRAYRSVEEAFEDYVRLIEESARYERVRGARTPQQFAKGLQQGGYATDPNYARKLVGIIARIQQQTANPWANVGMKVAG